MGGSAMFMKSKQLLAENGGSPHNAGGDNSCFRVVMHKEPPPMWIRESDERVQLNWVAIVSVTTSAAVCVAIWAGIFHIVSHYLR
jgi:hypothetical protein